MDADSAELSSIRTTLDDLTRRVTRIADERAGLDDDDPMPTQLYEVERLLRQAVTRLDRLRPRA